MTTQERLEEAEQALHELEIGRGVVSVTDQSGEKISYAFASRVALIKYIRTLKRELGILNEPRGPIQGVF